MDRDHFILNRVEITLNLNKENLKMNIEHSAGYGSGCVITDDYGNQIRCERDEMLNMLLNFEKRDNQGIVDDLDLWSANECPDDWLYGKREFAERVFDEAFGKAGEGIVQALLNTKREEEDDDNSFYTDVIDIFIEKEKERILDDAKAVLI